MRKILYIFCTVALLASCGTIGRHAGRKNQLQTEEKDPLTYEQRRKYDLFFLEAVRMKEKGDYDAAFELYQHCLDIYPTSAVTLYEISRFYMALGQETKGVEALAKAVELDQDNFWYKEQLANYYQNKHEWLKAISVYESMSKQFPSRLEPLISLVELYEQNKDYQQVVNVLDRLEELDGKSEHISMEKFRMYIMLGNKENAFSEIENLSKEYPYDMQYKKLLGDVYLDNGKNQDAYNIYSEILKEDPNYAPALLSVATYYKKNGQDSLYRKQIDFILQNSNVESVQKMEIMRQEIIRSEQTTKDSTAIISLFEKIMEKPQPDANIPMLYSEYLIMKKMQKESVPVLNKVLEIDPENKPARLQLLSYAVSQNDREEVIRVATPGLEYNPETMEFYYYLGIAHYQNDDSDKALEVFEKAVEHTDEKVDKGLVSDFYALIGDIYNAKMMREKAYEAYDSALVYNDSNIAALNNYAYYLSVDKKRLDKAEEMSYKTVKAEPTNSTYLDTYAWILFEKGRYTEARIYIDQAMKNEQEKSHVIVEHCGDIYYKLGEKSKALEYWKEAEVLYKNAPEKDSAENKKNLRILKKKIRLKRFVAE